jgi:hypothetical protein
MHSTFLLCVSSGVSMFSSRSHLLSVCGSILFAHTHILVHGKLCVAAMLAGVHRANNGLYLVMILQSTGAMACVAPLVQRVGSLMAAKKRPALHMVERTTQSSQHPIVACAPVLMLAVNSTTSADRAVTLCRCRMQIC